MAPPLKTILVLALVALVFGASGLARPRPVPATTRAAPVLTASGLPDTSAQEAVVGQYLDLLVAERYAEAWRLLSPAQQWQRPADRFAATWRERGRILTRHPDTGQPVLFIWPSAIDEVRAEFRLQPAANGRDRGSPWERVLFRLVRVDAAWRIAGEYPRLTPSGQRTIVRFEPWATPESVVRNVVRRDAGALYLPTVDLLYEAPHTSGPIAGRLVVFRALYPALVGDVAPRERDAGSLPVAILLFIRPAPGGWTFVGGGGVGDIILLDRYPVACALTWLRLPGGPAHDPAYYCTVEDPRVAVVEIVREDGNVQRADVGRRTVVFPFAGNSAQGWPPRQPRAIRLFDPTGRPLDLPTSAPARPPDGPP